MLQLVFVLVDILDHGMRGAAVVKMFPAGITMSVKKLIIDNALTSPASTLSITTKSACMMMGIISSMSAEYMLTTKLTPHGSVALI